MLTDDQASTAVRADRYRLTASELKRVLERERSGAPFLSWRAVEEFELNILPLEGREIVVVGRRSSCDLTLGDDASASRVHARLEAAGDDWLLLDDGISRNGTWINGVRARGYHRLTDGDRVRFGETLVCFHHPGQGQSAVTDVSAFAALNAGLTPTQRRVLVALCRPCRERAGSTPASNPEIAKEVFLGVDAVKAHLRELYRRFDIDLPQNQKRARLAEQALALGLADDGTEA